MIVTLKQANQLKDLGMGIQSNGIMIHCKVVKKSSFRNIAIPIKREEKIVNNVLPSVSDALQWLRYNKNIVCGVSPICETYKYQGVIATSDGYIEATSEYPTHPEAESALLDAVLTHLKSNQ